jgi:hypothetical protein
LKKLIFTLLVVGLALLAASRLINRPQPTAAQKILAQPAKGKVRVDFDPQSDIQQAQAMLEKESAGFVTREVKKYSVDKKKVMVRRKDRDGHVRNRQVVKNVRHEWTVEKLENYDVLLAVENAGTREIKIIRVKPGKQVDGGFAVEFEKTNGVNTEFVVTHPKDFIVLAIRRVVRSGKGFAEVVYTPFSEELNIPVLRQAGLDYVKAEIAAARQALAERGVKSRAYPGQLVSDAVPEDVALALSMIEHIDPARFERGGQQEQLINQVLVTIGANRSRAFQYSVSKAGARGLFQFIPRTYATICARYPSAHLNPEFVSGMNDHRNAAMASLLLFDSDLSVLGREQRAELKKQPEAMGQFLAAAYNCGAGRTKSAIAQHGPNWTTRLLPETCVYLKKFDAVWPIFRSV